MPEPRIDESWEDLAPKPSFVSRFVGWFHSLFSGGPKSSVGQEQPPVREKIDNPHDLIEAEMEAVRQALHTDRVRAGDVDETPLRAGLRLGDVSMGTSVARELENRTHFSESPSGQMYCAICGPDQPCRGHFYQPLQYSRREDQTRRIDRAMRNVDANADRAMRNANAAMERVMRNAGVGMEQAMQRMGQATRRMGLEAQMLGQIPQWTSVSFTSERIMLMEAVGQIRPGHRVTLTSSGHVREAIPGEPVIGTALEGVDAGGNIRIVLADELHEVPPPPPVVAEKHIERKLTELGREPPKPPERKNAWQRLVEDDTLDE